MEDLTILKNKITSTLNKEFNYSVDIHFIHNDFNRFKSTDLSKDCGIVNKILLNWITIFGELESCINNVVIYNVYVTYIIKGEVEERITHLTSITIK